VSYRAWYRFWLPGLIIATLGLKIILGSRNLDTLDTAVESSSRISALLAKEGFAVTVDRPSEGFSWPIEASNGGCRLRFAPLAADGSTLNQVRSHVARGEGFFVVFDGRLYRDQPVFWTALFNIAPTLRNALGLKNKQMTPLALDASGDCKVESLPWDFPG
jgi:hypothetical protein